MFKVGLWQDDNEMLSFETDDAYGILQLAKESEITIDVEGVFKYESHKWNNYLEDGKYVQQLIIYIEKNY